MFIRTIKAVEKSLNDLLAFWSNILQKTVAYAVGGSVIIFLAVLGWYWLSYALAYLMPDNWQLKYVVMYGAPVKDISIETKPTSCDWGRAPMGDKGCHYEKVVHVTRWDVSEEGKGIFSEDDGKTWKPYTFAGVEGVKLTPEAARKFKTSFVTITWEKKEDP